MTKLRAAFCATILPVICAAAFAKDPSPPPSTVLQVKPDAEIQVTGYQPTSRVAIGKNVRFWLTIRNRMPYSVFQVRLRHLDAAGFEIARRCWCEGGPDACWETAQFQGGIPTPPPRTLATNDCELVVSELKPGQTITVWGDLRAVESQESSTLTAVVGWQTAEKIESQSALNLGPCTVAGWWERRQADLGAFLKDFGLPVGLPIVLLVLGWRFQQWDKQRELDRQKAEKKRDEERHEQEEQRAQVAEQWSIMLPDSRNLSRRYYLPWLSAVMQATGCLESVVKGLAELQEQKDAAARAEQEKQLAEITQNAFYYWILSWRQLRNVSDSVGGLHFKDRVGEKLTAWCQIKYVGLYLGDNADLLRTYARILDHIGIHEKLDSFRTKFDNDVDALTGRPWGFQEGWKHFKEWVRSPECAKSILYLKGFSALMEYEANRPFEYWYGGVKERLNIDPATERELLALAAEIAQANPAMSNFPKKVEEYLAEGKRAVKQEAPALV